MPKKVYLLLVLTIASALTSTAQSDFEMKADYQDVNRLYNIYRESANPAFIDKLQFTTLTDVNLGYKHQSGTFNKVDESTVNNGLDFNLYGIKKYGKLAFEGSFAYNYDKQSNKRWNSTLFISENNPFVVGDIVKSDFTREDFTINGGVSYQFTPALTAGLRADFKAGSSANETDPRPDIKSIRFNVNPGLSLAKDNNTYGISLNYERLSESMEYSQVLSDNYNTYLMKGLAQPETRSALYFKRKYFGDNFGGNLQWIHIFPNNKSNYLEVGYLYKSEEAQDGATASYYHGGEYANHAFTLVDRLAWSNSSLWQQLALKATGSFVTGTIFEQTQTYDETHSPIWVINNKYNGHTDNEMKVTAAYNFDRLKDSLVTYGAGATIGFIADEIKDKHNGTSEKFCSINAGLEGHKTFYLGASKKIRLKIALAADYNKYLSKNIKIPYDTDVSPYKIIANNYLRPLFEYKAADYIAARLKVNADCPVNTKWGTTWVSVYAHYAFKGYTGNYKTLHDTYTDTYGDYAKLYGAHHNIVAGVKLTF